MSDGDVRFGSLAGLLSKTILFGEILAAWEEASRSDNRNFAASWLSDILSLIRCIPAAHPSGAFATLRRPNRLS